MPAIKFYTELWSKTSSLFHELKGNHFEINIFMDMWKNYFYSDENDLSVHYLFRELLEETRYETGTPRIFGMGFCFMPESETWLPRNKQDPNRLTLEDVTELMKSYSI